MSKIDTRAHKARIAARFAAAVDSYDSASRLQREAAQHLVQDVLALALPKSPRVLEIGCGSGHLSCQLQPLLGGGDWLLTDIVPAMVHRARERCQSIGGVAMDGEAPALRSHCCDLIVSNLAVQWFVDLPSALLRWHTLLAPGGSIAFSTFGAASFTEWQTAHTDLGLVAATPQYPDARELAHLLTCTLPHFKNIKVRCWRTVLPQTPWQFMRSLRALGADTPRLNSRPLSAGQLRRVIRHLEAQAVPKMTYEILLATLS